MRNALQHVECFHLVLLRMLEARVDRDSWVVKGGVNLRAWFGSLRYSEDLALDVVRGGSLSLREKVDRLLASSPFREMLATRGLTLTRATKPKQAETTQRWKFEIQAVGMTLQVSPYLTPEHQEIYGTPDAWDRICELVVDRLTAPAG